MVRFGQVRGTFRFERVGVAFTMATGTGGRTKVFDVSHHAATQRSRSSSHGRGLLGIHWRVQAITHVWQIILIMAANAERSAREASIGTAVCTPNLSQAPHQAKAKNGKCIFHLHSNPL